MLDIRKLTMADLDDIAQLHVQAWRDAYQGIVPQDFLDTLDPAARRKNWENGLAAHGEDVRYGTLLARMRGQAVGFISYGPARDKKAPFKDEIYALNIIGAHWGQGVGYSLFSHVRANFRARGAAGTYLWVLKANDRARNAYQRWGGAEQPQMVKTIEVGGATLEESAVTFHIDHGSH